MTGKEIAGGKYDNLLILKIAIDAKKIIHEERPEFFGYRIKELTASEILAVAAVYLSARTRFEEEQEQKEKEKDTERISDKDIGWFPGDCCD